MWCECFPSNQRLAEVIGDKLHLEYNSRVRTRPAFSVFFGLKARKALSQSIVRRQTGASFLNDIPCESISLLLPAAYFLVTLSGFVLLIHHSKLYNKHFKNLHYLMVYIRLIKKSSYQKLPIGQVTKMHRVSYFRKIMFIIMEISSFISSSTSC